MENDQKRPNNAYKRQQRSKRKEQSRKHRSRLVVHNLPFNATEEEVKKHFSQFGDIEEVVLLKKEPGVLTGCGFVQYTLVQKAAKARHHLNGKPFMGRVLTCDFAKPKDLYEKAKEIEYDPELKIKDEPIDFDESLVKDEIKEESNSEEESTPNEDLKVEEEELKEEAKEELEEENKSELSSEEEEDDDVESESEHKEQESSSDEEEIEESQEEPAKVKTERKKVISNDASEGKTIFIKNCPFTAENEDLEECMGQFGPLHYALVCIDPLTEHSKGTAFVKFQNKEDADKCLNSTNTILMGHTLQCVKALTREEIQNARAKDTSGKDTRNLYLVKEGLILAGTKAAEGVSASDMAKRLQVEQYKNQMLKNLNMFVARTRLVVHNIPANWDDLKLRNLFKKHVSPKAHIKEARIMRNMRQVDGKGIGKSKEFGFVTFSTHEDALQALRSLNNNPTIFSTVKRPIVAFSIENRAKLNAKQKQIENSKLKNPSYKHNILDKIKKPNTTNKKAKKRKLEETVVETNEYSGVTAKPGVKKMRSKYNLKTQAQLHHERLKQEKKQKKLTKKSLQEKQKEFTKQEKQKVRKKQEKDDFSKLVNKYKKELFGNNTIAKTKKWFES